jgi:hypothetical protein
VVQTFHRRRPEACHPEESAILADDEGSPQFAGNIRLLAV